MMQHKFLLRFIKEEMEKEKIIPKSNKAFLRLFLTDEPWESYRSSMSNWLSSAEDGVIRKRIFIAAINEKLGLSDDIWVTSVKRQKEAVVEGVQYYKQNFQDQEESLFRWVENEGMNTDQITFLEFVKGATLEEIVEKLKSKNDLLEKRASKQSFLIAFFEMMYVRGEYEFVYEYIFPYLLDTYGNDIKSKKADIYASLPIPMYREAFEILNSIKGESKEETINLKTATISNIRRERLSSVDLQKDEVKTLLETLIKCYTKIYIPNESYGYYPGINLAYMVALTEHIFPDEYKRIVGEYSVGQIYQDVQASIVQAKASENVQEQYYASMSEIEFQLLLNRKGMTKEFEYMLETLNPTINLIYQTQRQMRTFFLEVIEKFSDKAVVNLDEFKSFLDVFESYKTFYER